MLSMMTIKSIGEQVVVLLTLTLLTKEIVNLRFSTLSLRKVTYLSFILFLLLLLPFIALWNFNAEIHIDFVFTLYIYQWYYLLMHCIKFCIAAPCPSHFQATFLVLVTDA